MDYKILLIRNRFTKLFNYEKALKYFKEKTPLNVTVNEIKTDFDLSFTEYSNATWKGFGLDGTSKELFRTIVPRNTYHAVVVVYGKKAPGVRVSATNFSPLFPETEFIQLVKTNDSGKTMNHELFHTFFNRLRRKGIDLPDPMDTYLNDKSYTAKESNRTQAIELLKNYWQKVCEIGTIKYMYKYFKDSEIVGLNPDFVTVLDSARELAGTPFVITSGFRTPEHNKEVGGVPNSAHLRGLAVDIACTDGLKRTKILYGLLNCGKPLFIEVAKGHIHTDCDPTIHPMGSTIVVPSDN